MSRKELAGTFVVLVFLSAGLFLAGIGYGIAYLGFEAVMHVTGR